MIVLAFNVTGTDLRRTDINKIVAVSRNNVEAKFSFNSDWDNISPKVVQFYKDNKYYDVSLPNNECIVPWEVLTSAGTLSVTVTGGNLITTTTVDINVYGSGLSSTGLAPTKASPGVYSEIVKLANEIETDYNGMKSIMDTYEETVNTAMTDISEFVANAHESKIEAEESAESAANSLEDLKNTVINIHNSNEGNVVSVADASDKKIEEINVFGKSTQVNMPTMDEPVLIVNNFDNLKVTIYIANKNLLAVPYTKDNPLTLTSDRDDYNKYYASYPFYVVEGQTYTFSFESDGNAGGTTGTDTVQAGLFDTTNNIHYMTTGNKYLTFVAKKTGKCIFRCDVNKDGCAHSFWNFKVEVGDVNTDYATGEKQSIDVTLTEPLRGVVVNSGGNYTDNAGQEYLADVVCIKDGQIGVLRYVNYVRLTSSGFTLFREYDSENKISFQKSLGGNYYNESGLCTHLKLATDYNVNTMRLADRRIIVTVSSDYTLDKFKEFLNNNEVYLAITCKNNPIFEPFEEDTQAKFKNLTTYYGITNVCNSEGAYIRLNYTADTKLYIDNKFNELAKAIIATESEV